MPQKFVPARPVWARRQQFEQAAQAKDIATEEQITHIPPAGDDEGQPKGDAMPAPEVGPRALVHGKRGQDDEGQRQEQQGVLFGQRGQAQRQAKPNQATCGRQSVEGARQQQQDQSGGGDNQVIVVDRRADEDELRIACDEQRGQLGNRRLVWENLPGQAIGCRHGHGAEQQRKQAQDAHGQHRAATRPGQVWSVNDMIDVGDGIGLIGGRVRIEPNDLLGIAQVNRQGEPVGQEVVERGLRGQLTHRQSGHSLGRRQPVALAQPAHILEVQVFIRRLEERIDDAVRKT